MNSVGYTFNETISCFLHSRFLHFSLYTGYCWAVPVHCPRLLYMCLVGNRDLHVWCHPWGHLWNSIFVVGWSQGECKKNEKITEPYYSISSTNYDSHMNILGLTWQNRNSDWLKTNKEIKYYRTIPYVKYKVSGKVQVLRCYINPGQALKW